MDLERERGITIKAQAVRVFYTASDDEVYQLNLIDTPGHVDFSYEVSRSLAACEGAILVVDATQGIEAQTLANTYLAIEADLEVVPVLNKIDLPAADPDLHARAIADLIGDKPENVLRISAKTGQGIQDVLEAVVAQIPPPHGDPDAPPRALMFDSVYDAVPRRGHVRACGRRGVSQGRQAAGDADRPDHRGRRGRRDDAVDGSHRATVGGRVGLPHHRHQATRRPSRRRHYDGGRQPRDRGVAGVPGGQVDGLLRLVPARADDYPDLRDALEKLQLNDAALQLRARDVTGALGFGFRCGFLGLLHMDIVANGWSASTTWSCSPPRPTWRTESVLTTARRSWSRAPPSMPNPGNIEDLRALRALLGPGARPSYVGSVMELCQERRGTIVTMEYIAEPTGSDHHYELPLAEIVAGLLRSAEVAAPRAMPHSTTSIIGDKESHAGQAGHPARRRAGGRALDDRATATERSRGQGSWSTGCKKPIPRQLFEVPIQAAIGSKVIARETINAMRKDVLAKCYGGDISRKRKLLEKQKDGKKRMKQVGQRGDPAGGLPGGAVHRGGQARG